MGILDALVKGGLPEELAFELRPEGGERGATGDLGRVNSLCKGPGAETVWNVQGIVRRPWWLEQNE